MGLIQHLSARVKSQLSDLDADTSDMLEPFYAILLTRLCDKQLLSKLIAVYVPTPAAQQTNILQYIWTTSEQNIIYQELANSHHIEVDMVAECILQSSPLAYNIVVSEADSGGMSVIDFLHGHREEFRSYLPAWVGAVIPIDILINEGIPTPSSSDTSEQGSQPTQQHRPAQPFSKPMPRLPQPSSKLTSQVNTEPLAQGYVPQPQTLQQPQNVTHAPQATAHQQTADIPQSASLPSQRSSKNRPALTDNILKIALPVLGISLIAVGGWWLINSQSQPQPAPMNEVIAPAVTNDSANNTQTSQPILADEHTSATNNHITNNHTTDAHSTSDHTASLHQNNRTVTPSNQDKTVVYTFDENNTASNANQPLDNNQLSNMITSQSANGATVYEFSQPEENNPFDELDDLVSTRIIAEHKIDPPKPAVTQPSMSNETLQPVEKQNLKELEMAEMGMAEMEREQMGRAEMELEGLPPNQSESISKFEIPATELPPGAVEYLQKAR